MPIKYLNVLIQNNGINEPWCDTVSYQVVALDPYFYSEDIEAVKLGAIANGGLSFPLRFPIIFGSITGGQGIVTNKDNTKAYPVIIIVRTCSNISIVNETTGESMNISVNLLDSDTLITDNRPLSRGLYLNGIKRIDLKEGNWLSCNVGDNQFSFSRNSLQSDKKHCTIELQSRWI